jgi:small subunit ribosomal protein S20
MLYPAAGPFFQADHRLTLDLPRGGANNTALFRLGPELFGIDTLANIQSAKKRARQAVKRRAHNVALRSRVRTAIKRVLKAVAAGDKPAAQAGFAAVVPEIDRMANKGLLHKNRAAHYKSQLNAKLRAMS